MIFRFKYNDSTLALTQYSKSIYNNEKKQKQKTNKSIRLIVYNRDRVRSTSGTPIVSATHRKQFPLRAHLLAWEILLRGWSLRSFRCAVVLWNFQHEKSYTPWVPGFSSINTRSNKRYKFERNFCGGKKVVGSEYIEIVENIRKLNFQIVLYGNFNEYKCGIIIWCPSLMKFYRLPTPLCPKHARCTHTAVL